LLNVNQLAQQYGLPLNPTPLPRPGEGDIFIQKRYSVLLTTGVTFFLVIAIAFVFLMERKRHKLGTEQVKTPPQTAEVDLQNSDLLL
jgi:hypothetical protein